MKIQAKIQILAKAMEENGLEEISVEDRVLFGLITKKINLSKGGSKTIVAAAPSMMPIATAAAMEAPALSAAITAAAPKISGTVINSPMVGVVYFSPEPDAKKFVEVGKSIKAGDTICLIEAMKTFSPVKAEKDGTIAEIIAKDGQVVEFDTPLVVIA
jgi:acetyl-CoA carboxylase biotin carboxyl carrier protein